MGLVVFELDIKIFQGNLQVFNWENRFELYIPLPTNPLIHRCYRQIHITLGLNPVISFVPGPVPELPGDNEDIEAGQIYEIQAPEVAFPRQPVRLRGAASRSRDRDRD